MSKVVYSHMKFLYTATTPKGKLQRGIVDAPSLAAAAEEIRNEGLLIVTLKKESGFAAKLLAVGWVTNVIKVTFAKHLSLMVRAGLPIDECIRVLRDMASGRFRAVLDGVLKAVESGRQLSEAFAEYPRIFSELFVSTIRAGETSGTLDKSLDDLADQLTKSFDLQRKIRSAMSYPVLVLTAALGIGVGLSLFVLPKVIKLFESISVNMPLSTRMLLGFSQFMVNHGVAFFIGLALAITGLFYLLRWKVVRPYSHLILLKLPIFGKLVRDYNLAVFSRTMTTLLKAGIAIGDAFQTASDSINNVSYKAALLKVKTGTESGAPASAAMEAFPKIFPMISVRMISVGERSGKLEETFGYLAQFYEDEVDLATKNLSTILEPVLLLFIGAVVALVAVAIISPIYNYIGSIERL